MNEYDNLHIEGLSNINKEYIISLRYLKGMNVKYNVFWGKYFGKVKNGQKKCPKIEKVDSGLQKHVLTA